MTFPAQTEVAGSLLADTKVALRIASTAYDDEIEALIAAAKADLLLSGVAKSALDATDPDALVKLAIVTYCKASFGLDNPDSEKFWASYASIKHALRLSSEYAQPAYSGLTGSITAASDELTISDADPLAVDGWLTVAGAGADGALLIARVTAIDDLVVTLSRVAGTTVTSAAVKIA